MPCYVPLHGYRSLELNASGKRSLVFNPAYGYRDLTVEVPCGQCIGCRLERSRQWAIRCVHEASLHQDNCFLTLTYDKEHLPEGGTLVKSHFQDFMKRFRFRFSDTRIRYFQCGEYGEKRGRPHYHALVFGFDFHDKQIFNERRGHKYFASETLADLWPFGSHAIGDANFETAAYVARYITKKLTGPRASEYGAKLPEYTTMSRRPGIARDWFSAFKGDVFPSDEVYLRGKKLRPPKYYTNLLEVDDLEMHGTIKARRKAAAIALKDHPDNEYYRMRTRLRVHESKAALLKRGYEDGTTADF